MDNDRFPKEIEKVWKASKQYKPVVSTDLQQAKNAFFAEISKEEEKTDVYRIRQKSNAIRPMYSWIGVAASIIILLGAVFLIRSYLDQGVPDFMKTERQLVSAGNKNIENIVELPDGSDIWLGKGTDFRYEQNFNETDRVAYLEGELFIHVKKDKNKPFVIKMEKNELRVLGTSFYLKSDKSKTLELKVEEGIVELSDLSNNKKVLYAGEEMSFDKQTGTFEAGNDQNPVVTNWRRNYLIFEDVPLMNVFDKLAIFFGVEFSIYCPRIHKMKGFTSLVQQSEQPKLSAFIKTLEKVYGIKIEKIGENDYKVHGDLCK